MPFGADIFSAWVIILGVVAIACAATFGALRLLDEAAKESIERERNGEPPHSG